MPNWCCGSVGVKGNPKDIEEFCKLFLFDDIEKADGEKYFARSFAETNWADFKKENLGGDTADFGVNFAWSCTSCMIDGYPDRWNECITLSDACKKYNVSVEITTEEGGIGFEEEISCDSDGELSESCSDMPTYKCKKCGEERMFPSSYNKNDLEDEECGDCEGYHGWECVE